MKWHSFCLIAVVLVCHVMDFDYVWEKAGHIFVVVLDVYTDTLW